MHGPTVGRLYRIQVEPPLRNEASHRRRAAKGASHGTRVSVCAATKIFTPDSLSIAIRRITA